MLETIDKEMAWARKMSDFAGWMISICPDTLTHIVQKERFDTRYAALCRFKEIATHAVNLPSYNQNVKSMLNKTLLELLK